MVAEPTRLGDALASAFDHAIAEVQAEILEHEEAIADARRRLANLQAIRERMDSPYPDEGSRH